jgi:hypothetical protein
MGRIVRLGAGYRYRQAGQGDSGFIEAFAR